MSSKEINQANLVDKTMSAFRWVAALRFAGQVINWVSTLIIIRFLTAEDYGVIALAEVFRTFLVLFSNVGFSQGLIKVEHLSDMLIRKTVGLLLSINVVLFAIQFLIAPYAADFYNNQDLEYVLKVLAFTYLLIPWSAVPASLVARNMDHKQTSKVRFFSDVLASCLSLLLAVLGYGYWALIIAIVFGAVFNCFWLNKLIKYPKRPSFKREGTQELFAFGAFVALSEILFVAYSRVDVVIAGRVFDVAEIGLYGVAIQLATMLMSKTVPLINNVAFPAFARMNALSGNSNEYLITTLKFSATFIFPIFLGVAMVGEELIGLVLGSKWMEITNLFAILVVSVPLRIFAYIIMPATLATAGGARLNLVNSTITLVFFVSVIFILLPMGLAGVAIAWSLTSICILLLAVFRGGKLLGISVGTFLSAVAPPALVVLIMCAALYGFDLLYLGSAGFYGLVKIPLGAVIYLVVFGLFFRAQSREVIHVLWRLSGRGKKGVEE